MTDQLSAQYIDPRSSDQKTRKDKNSHSTFQTKQEGGNREQNGIRQMIKVEGGLPAPG